MSKREPRTEVVCIRFTPTEMAQIRAANPLFGKLRISDVVRLLVLRGVSEEVRDQNQGTFRVPRPRFWMRSNFSSTTETTS